MFIFLSLCLVPYCNAGNASLTRGLHLQLHNLNDGNLLSVNVFLNKISIYPTCLFGVFFRRKTNYVFLEAEKFLFILYEILILLSFFFLPLVNESFLLRIYDIFMQKVIVRNVKADFKFSYRVKKMQFTILADCKWRYVNEHVHVRFNVTEMLNTRFTNSLSLKSYILTMDSVS